MTEQSESRSEPGRVMQANGGDCMRACVASLFNVALSNVPDLSDHGWQTELREWARPRGYGFVTIECPNEDVFRDSFSDGFLIVAGQSARDRLHAVIYKDGKLWHDPHPASTGIDRVRQVDFFYPLLPSAPRSERGRDTERLEWVFAVLNDTEIKRRVLLASDVHAGGAVHGIRMGDWRHSIDVAMQQSNERPDGGGNG